MTKNHSNYIWGYLIIIVLLIFNNLFLPMLNSGIYYPSESLPSLICSEGKKIADNTEANYLTFGPYISVDAQKLYVEVYYQTDSNDNTIDIYSGETDTIFYSGKLNSDGSKIRIEAEIPVSVSDLEVRTYYSGNGYLSIDGVKIITRQYDLTLIIIIYDIILLGIAIGVTINLCKKHKKTENNIKNV